MNDDAPRDDRRAFRVAFVVVTIVLLAGWVIVASIPGLKSIDPELSSAAAFIVALFVGWVAYRLVRAINR